MDKEEQMIREIIRLNILQHRKAAGLSQEELGNMVGLKKSSISCWEKGKSLPDLATLYKLCKIFDISLDEMYGVKKEQPDAETLDTIIKSLQKLKEGGANEEP